MNTRRVFQSFIAALAALLSFSAWATCGGCLGPYSGAGDGCHIGGTIPVTLQCSAANECQSNGAAMGQAFSGAGYIGYNLGSGYCVYNWTQTPKCGTNEQTSLTGCVCKSGFEKVNGSCVASCSSGTHRDSSGSCVPDTPTCTSSQYLDPASNSCKDNPTCANSQHVDSDSHQCVADSPEPARGSTGPVFIPVCQSNCDNVGNWDKWPATMNCGGWLCVNDGPGQCVVLTTGVGGCYTNGGYDGMGLAPPGTKDAASPPSGDTTNAPKPQSSCPTGYVLDSLTGLCKSGSVPGSPTTPDSPGTSGQPGGTTCPVGYASDGNGKCISTSSPGPLGCPDGYTVVNGKCQGSGNLPPVFGTGAGSGANSVGSCGGPGQSPCTVIVEGPSDYSPINNARPSDQSQQDADGFFSDVLGKIGNWSGVDPVKDQRDGFISAWAELIEPIPSSTCQPIVAVIDGRSWTWDHCPVADKISTIGDYAMWIYFSIGVFLLFLGGAAGRAS